MYVGPCLLTGIVYRSLCVIVNDDLVLLSICLRPYILTGRCSDSQSKWHSACISHSLLHSWSASVTDVYFCLSCFQISSHFKTLPHVIFPFNANLVIFVYLVRLKL